MFPMRQTNTILVAFLLISPLLSLEGRTVKKFGEERKVLDDERCSSKDIQISQSPIAAMPGGIPQYIVVISNTCASRCSISNIHVSCGMFSSARLVDPNVFKRLSNNDCLASGGHPLPNGRTLSFTYANSFPYSLSITSVQVHC